MSLISSLHLTDGRKAEAEAQNFLETDGEYKTSFVSVDICEGSNRISVFLDNSDLAEIIGLEFLKAAKMIKEHQAKNPVAL